MSWFYYEDRREAKARVLKEVLKRRKRGEALVPVEPKSKRGISATFWGKAWNKNLEDYSDYENRLPRGRTDLRQGAVMDLMIAAGEVTSTVQGSDLYEVRITITPLQAKRWKNLKEECAGKIGSLVELLAGRLSDEIMAHVTDPKEGLFPSPKEIRISCSCPDYAGLCKHAAATLYAVSCRLDDEPGLLFTLRGVDAAELIDTSAMGAVKTLTQPNTGAGNDVLAEIDLEDVFGISFEAPETVEKPAPKAASKKSAAKKAAKKPTPVRKPVPRKAASPKPKKKS
jgi:uncharacterized Zn finger protein